MMFTVVLPAAGTVIVLGFVMVHCEVMLVMVCEST